MARIGGVNLPKDKRVQAALTAIFGIGKSTATKILQDTKVNKDTKVDALSEQEIDLLRQAVAKYTIEGDLKRKVALDVKRLQEVGSYRGFRHKRGLPCRGQRTRQNSRTRKGKKKTVANKKIAAK